MKKCTVCGHESERGKFCPKCGSSMDEMQIDARLCSHCGKEMRERATFCNHCGGKISPSGGQAELMKTDMTVAVRRPPAEAPMPSAGGGAYQTASHLQKPQKKSTGKKAILISAIASICAAGLALGAIYFLTNNEDNIQISNSPDSLLREPDDVSPSPITETASPESTPTPTPTPTPTSTPAPTPTPTPTPAPTTEAPASTPDSTPIVIPTAISEAHGILGDYINDINRSASLTMRWSNGTQTIFERASGSNTWMMRSRTGDYREVVPTFSYGERQEGYAFVIEFRLTTDRVYYLFDDGAGYFSKPDYTEYESLTWDFTISQ